MKNTGSWNANFFLNKFIYLFIFGCTGSLLLCAGFLQLWRAGATLCCGARASHFSGFSCCGARALGVRASVVAARGLNSCGSRAQQLWLAGSRAQAQQLWRTGLSSCGMRAQQLWLTGSRAQASVVVAHGLSCSVACGIFLDQGSNPCPLHWQADS